MTLEVSVDELDINSVEIGQEAVVTFDAIEEKEFTGEVTEIGNTASVNGSVAKYTVSVSVPKDEEMKQGMNASATITIENRENVITIPVNALQEKGEKAFVYTEKDEDGQDEGAFSIVDQSEIMEAMSGVTNTMSLMIGGIGIMNIMLVSVTERTREIGIRKAIGAGRGTIMLQFLIEALLISLMGCLAGIGLSWLILKAAAVLMDDSMSFTMDMKVVWLSVAFSVLIGVLFGLYPANKAASRKPIDALRYSG